MYGDGILYSGPTVYSNEIVVNGNFETDSDWNKTSGVTISNNKATINVTGGGFESLTQPTTYDVGEKYILKLTIQGLPGSSGKQIRFQDEAGNLGTLFQIKTLDESEQNFQAEWIPNAQSDIIRIARSTTSGDYSFTVIRVSIKKITQGSDFEFTRDTTGTRINEEGYIEDVPYNLAFYSEDISRWDNFRVGIQLSNIVSPLNSTGVYLLEDGTQTDNHYRKLDYQTLDPTNTYTQSFFVKKKDNGIYPVLRTSGVGGNSWVTFNWDTETLVQGPQITSSKVEKLNAGWYRISMVFSGLASTGFIIGMSNDPNDDLPTYTGNNNRFYAWGCQIVKGNKIKNYLPTTDRVNLPRLNYPVYGGCPSLLVEPQRTNSNNYSSDFTQTFWSKQNGVTVSSNQTKSPDNIVNADKLISANLTNEQYLLNASISTTSGNDVTISCFIKKLDYDYFHIRFTATNGVWVAASVWYNIDNGTLGTVESGITAKIIEYPNGWYRCIATRTATGTGGGRVRLQLASSDNTPNVVGDGTKGTFIYGAQWEVGSYATSYIPTSSSTVTRNEEKALYAGLGTTDTFNDDEGVLFIETEALVNNNEARGININAGSGTNRVLISYPSSGDSSITGYLQSTAGSGASMTITGVDTTQKHKVAIKYKLNDASLFIDGVKRAVDPSVAMPVGLKQLDFSNGVGANTAEYRGNLNAIAVYKTALTDTELANLTSYNNHDLFIPYRSRMQMIGADQELQCTEHDITRFL